MDDGVEVRAHKIFGWMVHIRKTLSSSVLCSEHDKKNLCNIRNG
jgi:hypothetical protein